MSFIYSYFTATYRVLFDRACELYNNSTNDTANRMFTESSIYDKYTTFFQSPTHIIDNIYLGSAYNAANFYQLKDLNIEIILNVTNEISKHFPTDFIYKHIGIYDNDTENIKNYKDNIAEILNYLKNNKDKNILIHCKMGASRSVSILILYLMENYNMTLDESVKYIKDKRNIINPNINFINSINNEFYF